MIARGLALVGGIVLALGTAAQAQNFIPGGGNAAADCYAELDVRGAQNPGTTGNQVDGNKTLLCTDGEACDQGACGDDKCTLSVALCINQRDPNLTGCQPPASLDSVKVKSKGSVALNVNVPQLLQGSQCGAFVDGELTVTFKKNGKPKIPKTTINITAKAPKGTKPRTDGDKITLKCLPRTTPCPGGSTTTTTLPPSTCPPNPAGGPRELKLTTLAGGQGGDLDNGFNGGSHNFPLVDSSILDFCLSGCGGADTSCTGTGATGAGTTNTASFGAPLPLIAGTPVCVVNRFGGNISVSEADYTTGAVTASVPLLSDVYITTATEVCPQCSGNGPVGSTGNCRGGRNAGRPCTVGGLVRVEGASVPDKNFELSADCPPSGQPAATLTIGLDPFTTGVAMKSGSKPCQGQARDDGCTAGGTCTNNCSSSQPTPRGGYDQYCCSNQDLPCFPTAPGTIGALVRNGSGSVPSPQGSFPASSSVILASVFCEGATGVSAIDNVAAGLPGPGALLQPMSAQWLP